MSAGIILNADLTWIVAGWAADHIATQLRRFLVSPDDDKVLTRLEAIGLYPGSLANFEDAEAQEVSRLYLAAIKGLAATEDQGAASWEQPEFFPGYLAQFRKLVNALSDDPRSQGRHA